MGNVRACGRVGVVHRPRVVERVSCRRCASVSAMPTRAAPALSVPWPRAAVPPLVFTRAEALAAGSSRHRVQALSRSGAWHRLTTGVYCPAGAWQAADVDERARLTAAAVARRWRGTATSHLSAAALWHLPLPLLPHGAPDAGAARHCTWLTAPPSAGVSSRRAGDLVVEVAALPDDHVVAPPSPRYGPAVRTTALARTAADCLRHLPTADAVAIADAAGAAGMTRAQLHDVLASQAAWPHAAAARAATALVDPRRETWLESTSWVALAGCGLPLPEPQVEVWTLEGRFIARVDGLWRQHGVVGEADGWGKYRSGGLVSVGDAERALRTEKQREDALRDVGLEVARWGTHGVTTPQGLLETEQRLRRAMGRGDPARVRAQLRSTPMPSGW